MKKKKDQKEKSPNSVGLILCVDFNPFKAEIHIPRGANNALSDTGVKTGTLNLNLGTTASSSLCRNSSRQLSFTAPVSPRLGVLLNINLKAQKSSPDRWSKQRKRPSGPAQLVVSDNRTYFGVEGWQGVEEERLSKPADFRWKDVTWCAFLLLQVIFHKVNLWARTLCLFAELLVEIVYFAYAGLHLTPERKKGNKQRQ